MGQSVRTKSSTTTCPEEAASGSTAFPCRSSAKLLSFGAAAAGSSDLSATSISKPHERARSRPSRFSCALVMDGAIDAYALILHSASRVLRRNRLLHGGFYRPQFRKCGKGFGSQPVFLLHGE